MKSFSKLSIKSKFLQVLIFSSIIPIMVLGIYSYVTSIKALDKELDNTALQSLNHITAYIDLYLQQVSSYAENISDSSTVNNLLDKSRVNTNITNNNKDINSRVVFLKNYINIPVRVMIISEKLQYYYDFLCDDKKVGDSVKKIEKEKWYKENDKYDDATRFIGVLKSYINNDEFETEYHYYFYRNIINDKGDFNGIVLLDLDKYTIDRLLSSSLIDNEDTICLVDENSNILSSTDLENGQKNIKNILNNDNNHVSMHITDSEVAMTSTNLINRNWTIVYYPNKNGILKKTGNIILVTAVIIAVLLIFECMLYIYVNINISKPIIQLSNLMSMVEKGNLEVQSDFSSYDEIGLLASGFNKMVLDIKKLIGETKKDQQRLKKLEFSMLQAQINPHFLYNSLNGIKWMADLMGCENIGQAISCLIKLLQYSIGSSADTTTLKKEIEYIESYIYLNNIRFKNKFKFINNIPLSFGNIEIKKFILQPIVENSIEHGLKEKPGLGTIELCIKDKGEFLVITIKDNGVGFAQMRLREILNSNLDNYKDSVVHFGISNVDRRLKLLYGEMYGIKIESEPGEGAKVSIIIPYKGGTT